MDYKASEFLMESMKDLFADRIKLSPELTETIKPETMFLLLEALRLIGIASVTISHDGSLKYTESKDMAPLIIEDQKRKRNQGKVGEFLHVLDLVGDGKMDLADAESFLAETFLQQGKIDEAMDTIDIIEKTPISNIVPKNIGRIFRIKGALSFYKGDYEGSINYLNKAVEKCELSDDIDCVAFSLLGLGNVYSAKGEYEESFQKYERSYILFKEKDYLPGMAKIKINLSYTYSRMGLLQKSTEANKDAILLAQRLNDLFLLEECYLNRCSVLLVLGMHEEAYESIMNSYLLSLETTNKRVFHLSRLMILSIDIAFKRHNLTYHFVEEAIEYFTETENEVDLAFCNELITEYYIANGMQEETRSMANITLNTYDSLSDLASLVSASTKLLRMMIIYKSPQEIIKETYKKATMHLKNTKLFQMFKKYTSEFLTKNYQL
jgi:tetratricopeptide (TPR) repeat protein